MNVQTIDMSPRNHRGGQTSYLLLGEGQFGSRRLAVTWVEGSPGSRQPLHEHPSSEQAYIIVAGRGLMIVGDEEREVGLGTMVLIPPGAPHAIECIGEDPLIYVSATSPPFSLPPTESEFGYRPPSPGPTA